jgi:hypothetical protein
MQDLATDSQIPPIAEGSESVGTHSDPPISRRNQEDKDLGRFPPLTGGSEMVGTISDSPL